MKRLFELIVARKTFTDVVMENGNIKATTEKGYYLIGKSQVKGNFFVNVITHLPGQDHITYSLTPRGTYEFEKREVLGLLKRHGR